MNLWNLFQVKIWFQNRRTKWKKQENLSNAEAAEHRIGTERRLDGGARQKMATHAVATHPVVTRPGPSQSGGHHADYLQPGQGLYLAAGNRLVIANPSPILPTRRSPSPVSRSGGIPKGKSGVSETFEMLYGSRGVSQSASVRYLSSPCNDETSPKHGDLAVNGGNDNDDDVVASATDDARDDAPPSGFVTNAVDSKASAECEMAEDGPMAIISLRYGADSLGRHESENESDT